MKHLLILSSAVVAFLAAGCRTAEAPTTAYPSVGALSRLDPRFTDLVPEGARLERVAEGFEWSEGPVWSPEGYLLFSDIPRNTIFKWSEEEGLSIFMRPAGHAGNEPPGEELGTNGLLLEEDGSIVAADHGNRAIVRVDDEVFTREVLAGAYEGKRLNSPNDAVFNRRGDVYFTDPPYGLRGLNDSPVKQLDVNGVYLLTQEGRLTLLSREFTFPNGVALSPDEQTLYVAQSDGARPIIMAFDVQADGTAANGRVLFDGSALQTAGKSGAFDGLAVDRSGNLFATGPGGVLVITPAGEHLGTIETGQATSNCTFGGPDLSTLYITADMYLLRIKLNTQGIRSSDLRASTAGAATSEVAP